MSKIGLFWRTIQYLKSSQILYQIWNRLRGQPQLRLPKNTPQTHFLTVPEADKPITWAHNTFTFLNQSISFPSLIDWNFAGYGKLWAYNLNYFDFLNQPDLSSEEGLHLIRDFISQTNSLSDGLESYPTSLRINNWVQFLSRHRIQDEQINTYLFAQTHLVSQRLEYHLAGNHLLENGLALLVGALYFRHDYWLQKAARLIRKELVTQILADGGHNERSPMYHQILLDRLLVLLVALQHDTWHTNTTTSLIPFLAQKATQMLDWLNSITFRNGDIPMVNDAAFGIAPSTEQLRQKASQVLQSCNFEKTGILNSDLRLRKTFGEISGYRMFRQNRYELFADAGAVGPDCQPGHAHADTFSFVLYVDNQPVIVDTGTSTYQTGQRRNWERSTAAHNTVEIAGTNSSEVWAGFRVGRRARVNILKNTLTALTGQHTGYRHLHVIHQRSWSTNPVDLTIVDRLLHTKNGMPSGRVGVARFHFHPHIIVQRKDNVVTAGPIQLYFNSVTNFNIHVTRYAISEGFNQIQSGQCLEIAFTNTLKTNIILLHEYTLPDVLL